jgi:arylsulfatase A-like enzyme
MISSLTRALLLLVTIGLLSSASLSAGADAQRPDVLFIAVDDLNDWIGVLGGHPDAKTPNIDRLAQRGIVFERAYCSAAACNPSRASLLHSITPAHSGVYQNDQPWRDALRHATSLPKLLSQQGYEVIGGGKIYHGGFPEKDAWDDYFDKGGTNPTPQVLPHNGIPKTGHFDWGPVPEDDSALSDHRVVDWAVGELTKSREKPLFLAVGLTKPHLPWYVPQKYFDKFPLETIALPKINDRDLDDVPPAGRKIARPEGDHAKVIAADQYRAAVQAYLAAIAFADAEIGRLVDGLDKSPHRDNTIVVLWGDHGWHLGEKLHWRKFSLWEESARAPLIVVAPQVTRPGTRSSRVVSFLDVYPTVVDLVGAKSPPTVEGKSLRPLLENPLAAWDGAAVTTHGRNNHSVRTEQWRYIRYADGSEELYDHDADPDEWINLAAKPEHATLKDDLAKRLPEKNVFDAPSQKKKADEKNGAGADAKE